MRTQNQAVPRLAFTAGDLPQFSQLISLWSSRGFQSFFESGVFHDMVEGVKKDKIAAVYVNERNMLRLSREPGSMTLRQIRTVLENVPERGWLKSFYLSFFSWSYTAGWWDENPKIDWHLRDEFREEMRLEPINRAFISKDVRGRAIKVHLLKGYSCWPEVPKGFRFATMDEIEPCVLSGPESIILPDCGVWKSVYNGERSVVGGITGYIRNLRYLYPIVKI